MKKGYYVLFGQQLDSTCLIDTYTEALERAQEIAKTKPCTICKIVASFYPSIEIVTHDEDLHSEYLRENQVKGE